MHFPTYVVFDLDGVLADTIRVLYDIYAAMIAPAGGRATEEEFQFLNGKTLDEIVDHLVETHGIETDRESFRATYLEKMGSIYAMAEPSPGMPELLESLKQRGIRIGLASSAPRDGITLFLQRHNLDHYFEFIASGDEVELAKPNPAIYELTCQRLGVRPDGSVFLDDLGINLKPAKAMGMHTIKVLDETQAIDELARVTGLEFPD